MTQVLSQEKLKVTLELPGISSHKRLTTGRNTEVLSTSQIIKFNQSSNKDLHLIHQHQSITRPKHLVASKNTLTLSKFEPKFSNQLSHKSRLLI